MNPAGCLIACSTGSNMPQSYLDAGGFSRVLSDHAFSPGRLTAFQAWTKQITFPAGRRCVASTCQKGLQSSLQRKAIRHPDRSSQRCLAKKRTSKAVEVEDTPSKPHQLASGDLCFLYPRFPSTRSVSPFICRDASNSTACATL